MALLRQTGRKAGRKADNSNDDMWQTDRQTDRQADRQTEARARAHARTRTHHAHYALRSLGHIRNDTLRSHWSRTPSSSSLTTANCQGHSVILHLHLDNASLQSYRIHSARQTLHSDVRNSTPPGSNWKNTPDKKTKRRMRSEQYLANSELNDIRQDLVHLLQQLIPLVHLASPFPIG